MFQPAWIQLQSANTSFSLGNKLHKNMSFPEQPDSWFSEEQRIIQPLNVVMISKFDFYFIVKFLCSARWLVGPKPSTPHSVKSLTVHSLSRTTRCPLSLVVHFTQFLP